MEVANQQRVPHLIPPTGLDQIVDRNLLLIGKRRDRAHPPTDPDAVAKIGSIFDQPSVQILEPVELGTPRRSGGCFTSHPWLPICQPSLGKGSPF
jgi:hypothetical protein